MNKIFTRVRSTVNYDYYLKSLSWGRISWCCQKIFLHDAKELPLVRDLGFAISPGTHALVGIRLHEADNLGEPWGDCGTSPLNYSLTYTYSHCERECETELVLRKCNCRDAFMPGNSPGIVNLIIIIILLVVVVIVIDSVNTWCLLLPVWFLVVFQKIHAFAAWENILIAV